MLAHKCSHNWSHGHFWPFVVQLCSTNKFFVGSSGQCGHFTNGGCHLHGPATYYATPDKVCPYPPSYSTIAKYLCTLASRCALTVLAMPAESGQQQFTVPPLPLPVSAPTHLPPYPPPLLAFLNWGPFFASILIKTVWHNTPKIGSMSLNLTLVWFSFVLGGKWRVKMSE